jgi:hypothetical protein
MPAGRRADVTELRQLAGKVAPVVLAGEQLVPVADSVASLLPGRALRRGTVVSVDGPPGSGATSVLFGLLSAASQDGSWVAVVGMPSFGIVAAAEAKVALERLAVIPDPGGHWPMVTAALLDAIDLVVVRPSTRARPQDARRLATRARDRGGILLVAGEWPEGADVRLSVRRSRWTGLEDGHGFLRERTIDVAVDGRGAAGRGRRLAIAV